MRFVCLDNTDIDYNTFRKVEGPLVRGKLYFDVCSRNSGHYLGSKLDDDRVVLEVVFDRKDRGYGYFDASESYLREAPLFLLKGRAYYPGDTIGILYHEETKILRRKIKAFEWKQTSPLTAEDWYMETEDGSWYHCWLLTEPPPEEAPAPQRDGAACLTETEARSVICAAYNLLGSQLFDKLEQALSILGETTKKKG